MATFKLVLISSFLALVLSCSEPKDWVKKPMLRRIEEAKLIVYGQVKETTKSSIDPAGNLMKVQHTVDVHCVLKNTETKTVGTTIIINAEEPTPECVSNTEDMTNDKKVIVLLRMDEDKFRFDNVNVQGAVFEANSNNLESVRKSCNVGATFAGAKCPQKPKECVKDGATMFHATNLFILVLHSIVISLIARYVF